MPDLRAFEGRRMKKALLDTSSAILLFKGGLFDDCINKYSIVITDSVYDELTMDGYPGADEFKSYYTQRRLTVHTINERTSSFLKCFPEIASLDRGERDTLCQYIVRNGDFIIIDDGKGAAYCRDNRIPYINALLFPRLLYLYGDIPLDLYYKKMKKMTTLGRYSSQIITQAYNSTRDDLELFFP